MKIETAAAWATTFSLPAALVGLAIAIWQTVLTRRTTSASVLLDFSEAFASAWRRLNSASGDALEGAFGDLVNLLEAACAVYLDGNLAGRSGKLLRDYLINVLEQIERSEGARLAFIRLLQTDQTFEETRRFLRRVRRHRRDLVARLSAGPNPA